MNSKQDFLNYKYKVAPRKRNFKKDYSATSNSIFVGEYGYPNVSVGVLSAENYKHNDDSKYWILNNWKISQIADSRMNLVNSKKAMGVKQSSEYLSEVQEIALGKNPSDVEVSLSKVPFGKNFSKFHKPLGPSGDLEKLNLVTNPKVPSYVEKLTSDEVKSEDGLGYLYKKGYEKDYLVQAFTSGSLGIDKRIVPTKWGITAVDDVLGKKLIEEVKDFQKTGNLAYLGNYLGNYFIVLFFEGNFSYELFEFFRNAKDYTTDAENSTGRKKYALQTAGGYYAARISVLEKLKDLRRQSQALLLRFITDEYYMPLGVWVVRQAVKNTLVSKPMEFGSKELMLEFAIKFSKKKFNRDLNFLKQKSKVLTEKTVFDFGVWRRV